MRIDDRIAAAIATAIAVGILAAGSTVASPDVYHDLQNPATINSTAVSDSPSTSLLSPDVYHDL
jgi:hypothetical protein